MKNILFFLSILCLTFFGCDGRYHRHNSNAEVLKTNHLYESFSKQMEFLPEETVEIKTDTILSNGFELHLKYTTLDKEYQKMALKLKPPKELYYKNFGSELICKRSGKVIFEQRIEKSLFSAFETPEFWDKAIMQFVWIDYEASLNEKVSLNTSFYLPESNSYKDFNIEIYSDGRWYIKPISFVSKLI